MKWSDLIGTVMIGIFCGALSHPAHAFRADAYGCNTEVGGEGQILASLTEDCIERGLLFGTVSSWANLATGEVKATVAHTGGGPSPAGGGLLEDRLTIHGPFSPTGTVPVTLSLHIDGRMLGIGTGQQAGIFLS